MIEKNGAQSQSVLYITVLGRTDFEHPIYIESELFYRNRPFIKNVPFVETQKKCSIFKIGEQIPVNALWIFPHVLTLVLFPTPASTLKNNSRLNTLGEKRTHEKIL